MDTNILSFIRNQDYYSPKSVHERLYLDSSSRATEKKLALSFFSGQKPNLPLNHSQKIEDILMQKQAFAKTKLKALQAKYQSEELKEMRKIPEINPISRILAEKANISSRERKSAYINSILSTSRFTKLQKNSSCTQIKTANISLKDLNTSFSSTLQTTKLSIKEKNEYLEKLRKMAALRQNISEIEEPPCLLNMDVIQRNLC